VAYAVTEPDAGSNVASIKTKADPVLNDAGEIIGYKINGAKQFISTGGHAEFITLLANTPEGATFFVVEKDTEGYIRGKGEEKHGIRASNTSPLTFTDVFVPVENIIGSVTGQGLKQASKVFGYTRLMVASMALGGGEAALDIVIPYAKERIQFKTPLSEKQGYTHKLVVPHAVRLAAAATYIDEVATRLDAAEQDLEVEGSIAKLFATEAANKVADDAMQALGGYGYITEYGVEKIKRDVKITCIYEGTSEIQQNIISTFRWKKTRKSKGAYYDGLAEEMDKLAVQCDTAGCRHIGLAARALNKTVFLVNDNRLTREQYIMFALADMMMHVEVAASLARQAAAVSGENGLEAEKTSLFSRLFANETAVLVSGNILKILRGSGVFDSEQISAFLAETSHAALADSYQNIIPDMNRAADIIFNR
jgi:alkylation response protein AidB-like acyl-CoA dehydrogenase